MLVIPIELFLFLLMFLVDDLKIMRIVSLFPLEILLKMLNKEIPMFFLIVINVMKSLM